MLCMTRTYRKLGNFANTESHARHTYVHYICVPTCTIIGHRPQIKLHIHFTGGLRVTE